MCPKDVLRDFLQNYIIRFMTEALPAKAIWLYHNQYILIKYLAINYGFMMCLWSVAFEEVSTSAEWSN